MLRYQDLKGADLTHTDLSRTNLEGADLSYATLGNLRRDGDGTGTNLTEAIVNAYTDLCGVTFHGCQGVGWPSGSLRSLRRKQENDDAQCKELRIQRESEMEKVGPNRGR